MLALVLFMVGFGYPGQRLAAAAVGPDDAAAIRGHEALRRMGARAETAVGPLARSLPELTESRRRAVLETLGYLGPSAIEPLGESLHDQDGQVRAAALEALQHIGAPAVPELVAALNSDDALLRDAAEQPLKVWAPRPSSRSGIMSRRITRATSCRCSNRWTLIGICAVPPTPSFPR